ncbi:sticks and stones-like protein [Dermatophagoides farinae]|uniref:Sticks and stones-like protein n=1 Tax=Dermatophagoides farinae TaxID=6954 RepID=A0A9D4NWR6_DERFA|nr:sticks and stones-like protein [Dermatophagoides farinae]
MKKYSNNVKQQQQQQKQQQQQQQQQKHSKQPESIIDHYFRIKPIDVYVIEGDNTELKCQINPDIDNYGPVQWSKDGFLLGYEAIIPGHDRYIMYVNQTLRTYNLHIQNVQLDDEAEFECQTTSASSSTMTDNNNHHHHHNNNNNNDNHHHHHQQQQQNSNGNSNKQPIRAAAHLHLIMPPKVIYINSTRSFDNPNGGAGGGVGVAFRPLLSSSSNISSNHHYHQSELNSPFTLSSNHNSSSIFMVDAYEGEKIIIVCTVPYAKPPPRLKWYRKNIELLPEAAKTTVSKTLLSNRHTIYSIESSLILYPKIDEEYRCQAEHNGLSKPLRAMALINIYRQPSSPVIDGYKNGDIVNYQEKLNLKCTSINGYPPPTIIWYRNGIEIDRTYTIIMSQQQQNGHHEVFNTLSIIVDHNDNQAQYTCQVMNSLTAIPLQESITLNVFLFPTQIHIDGPTEVLLSDDGSQQQQQQQRRQQGTPITLECNAHPVSHQPNESKIRWLIDGKEVDSDDYYNNNNNDEHDHHDGHVNNNGHNQQQRSIINNVGNNNNNNNYVHMIKHDHQSWTLRSNITIVINNKEPNIRNIACIDPPEMPILLGVKNGQVTVFVGEIFKCKCVCYGGNPRANLIWLNQNDREISALATTTGTGINSELVLRPTSNDHGQIFRCHVVHPSLEKPYEVFFTLHVIFSISVSNSS